MFTILSPVLLVLCGSFYKGSNPKTCSTVVDSLTKRLVYTSADVLPENEGGRRAIMIKLRQAPQDTTLNAENYNPNYSIAFIVDVDGTIKGERALNRETDNTVRLLFAIVKSLKWKPAKCGNKIVPMLYKLSLTIGIADQ